MRADNIVRYKKGNYTKMKKNVFISSTFIDLEEYRKEIWQLLSQYNVNVLGMEQFGARKETPLETCINEVERSDIYVGIIAQRLGSIEPNSTKSYTQLEYEKAVELDKEILIYLIDEENALVKPVHIDYGKNHEQLNNFKKLLREKHTVDSFRDSQDIVGKLKSRLSDILTDSQPEQNEDPMKTSIHILEKFHLFPQKYNNREVRLKVKLSNDAFPLSKQACKFLGYKFGEAIAVSFKLIEPSINNKIEYMIINEEVSNIYFDVKNDEEIEIMARLLFSTDRISNLKAKFSDSSYTIKKENPHYDPNIPNWNSLGSRNFIDMYDNPKYITETKYIDSDSMLLLGLNRKIEKQ